MKNKILTYLLAYFKRVKGWDIVKNQIVLETLRDGVKVSVNRGEKGWSGFILSISELGVVDEAVEAEAKKVDALKESIIIPKPKPIPKTRKKPIKK